MRARSRPILLCAVFFSVLSISCSSDEGSSGPTATTTDFSGVWTVDFEIVARRVCDGSVGQRVNEEWSIGQAGDDAWIDLGRVVVPLTIVDDRATGTALGETRETYSVTMSIEDGGMAGTVTIEDEARPCSESWSFEASRATIEPSGTVAGTWDLGVTISEGLCLDRPVGTSETICRSIVARRGQIWIDDPDGPIPGVVTNDGTVFRRLTAEETVEVVVDENEGRIFGSIETRDVDGECFERATFFADPRVDPCPAPSSPGDFVGNWFFEKTGSTWCGDSDVDGALGFCVTIAADGTEISLDDGSGRPPLVGRLDGSNLVLRRSERDEEATMILRVEDGQLVGELQIDAFLPPPCDVLVNRISLEGTAISVACDRPGGAFGGPFDGSWTYQDAQATDEGCPTERPGACIRLFQVENRVFLDGRRQNGQISGNDVSTRRILELPDRDLVVTIEWEIELASDEQSLTLVRTITNDGPEGVCVNVFSATGVPAQEECAR